ncbi:DUF6686 family protein [Pedobacter sp. P351]|uniref:DUF6686 family protein n=1 Tax=Pedobacter superstes TaxID=3133441 RepID=UPI0030A3333B
MCETRVVSFNGNTQISYCVICKSFYIWHKNIVLNFTSVQFLSFKRYTEGLDFEECAFPFPDGEGRAMLHTPSKEISLAFTKDEWDSFSIALDEAGLMKQYYHLLYKQRD